MVSSASATSMASSRPRAASTTPCCARTSALVPCCNSWSMARRASRCARACWSVASAASRSARGLTSCWKRSRMRRASTSALLRADWAAASSARARATCSARLPDGGGPLPPIPVLAEGAPPTSLSSAASACMSWPSAWRRWARRSPASRTTRGWPASTRSPSRTSTSFTRPPTREPTAMSRASTVPAQVYGWRAAQAR